ncbi:MAG TPA: hypothetical protein EYO74_00790 [Piscirickettsiaceae bacterium]|jgi:hypothetical protein|nr:hypothetical protein [Piscirickettsiaceae bacterium]
MMTKVSIALLLTALVTGCVYSVNNTQSKYPKELVNGKVQIDDDLYYEPIGKDKDGCMMYIARSSSQATMTAVIYRNKNGVFTSNKSTSDCHSIYDI